MTVDSGVEPSDIDTGLGRPLTQDEIYRLQSWVSDAEVLIGARLHDDVLDPDVLALVVRMAVEYRWRMTSQTGGASSVTVSVDDGSVTRRYDHTLGDPSAWWFQPDWWDLLSPSRESGAFSTRPGFDVDATRARRWSPDELRPGCGL